MPPPKIDTLRLREMTIREEEAQASLPVEPELSGDQVCSEVCSESTKDCYLEKDSGTAALARLGQESTPSWPYSWHLMFFAPKTE